MIFLLSAHAQTIETAAQPVVHVEKFRTHPLQIHIRSRYNFSKRNCVTERFPLNLCKNYTL